MTDRSEMAHPCDMERWTMRCDNGHEQTYEVAAFAAWLPVHCPECPWHTPWHPAGEPERFVIDLAARP